MKIAIDNVIFQLQSERPRGISRVWLNILPYMERMLKAGNKLTLLSRVGSGEMDFGMKVKQIPIYTDPPRDDSKMLSSVCKDIGIDLFITTYHTKAPGVKNLVMVHDLIPERRNWVTSTNEYNERGKAYVKADILICVSENTKKDLCKWYSNINKNKMHVALEGVNPRKFHPYTSNEIASFLKEYKLKPDYLVLDGDIPMVTAVNLCRAISSLKTEIALFSYGGVLTPAVAKACQKYKIAYINVEWLPDNQVPLALAGAKGLIFISDGEGFGLPVLEAMACRTPVICSRIDSLPEVGGDSVDYFTSHDFLGLKSKISFLLKSGEKQIMKKAVKGFNRSKLFTWEKMARRIVEIIKCMRKNL